MKTYGYLFAASLALANMAVLPQAWAVGSGETFDVQEDKVKDAHNRTVAGANSVDFTYHACVQFGSGQNSDRFMEHGYLWISSYQNANSVLGSQINYYDTNGYRIYAKYNYNGQQVGMVQPSVSGNRLNYIVAPSASFSLYLDPDQNTALGLLMNCQSISAGTGDDILLGTGMQIFQGEKSETDGLANGDFESIYYWQFTQDGLDLFDFGNAQINYMMFNGNITELGGTLGGDHRPEGSGNLYWTETVPD